ncbi:molybdopterin-dependent oxidoreductase [Saccharopolyspora phatthalungensis]|uniref:Biotin/methionine sulfoxide reductase n=1 Tax=Saccharopolyspora phatthalungensis TaxID=664693 RepID=A0A840PZM2_9PSEU|nr:molybdopterin-dependent oxidoreductase [Saccharopolyspora phatthalungensis]MBB5153736.1 biotin/methionine sulfoxide reductase [Saccharopolyspora phatthalungensis]
MIVYQQHSSHWGLFTAARTPDGLDVVADSDDPDPAPLLRNIPASLDERVRVLAPHVRKGWLDGQSERGGDEYVPVSWPAAIELAASELDRVRGTYGNEAIYGGSYGWGSAGRFHHAQSQIHRFLNVIGGYTRSVNTYSLGASRPLLQHVVGNDDPIVRPTAWPVLAKHTEHFVCFGGIPAKNSQVNAGGVSRHAVAGHLRRARARGAWFTLISPLRDDLAPELGARWLAPVPGTDTALMLALSHVLIERGWHAEEFLRTHCVGFDEFWKYLSGAADGIVKSPQWAESVCGIDAAVIVGLAESMATRRTMVTLSWSLQRARYGEQPLWAGIALACVLGQIGLPGGGFGHGYGAMAGIGMRPLPYPLPTLPQGENRVREYIPVARIADMLLNPGQEYDYNGERRRYPDIRLVYWAGGNPFHHHQDLARLTEAFRRPETVLVHEPFWTATARHADIVFPTTTTLERNDLGCAKEDRALIAMRQVTPPLGQARSDFEIFTALAEKLGVAAEFTEGRDEWAWLAHLYEQWRQASAAGPDFRRFWEIGRLELSGDSDDQVLYDRFRADPAGNPLPTPSGRIELFSRRIGSFGYADCPGHPIWLVPEELQVPPGAGDFPLFLVANNPATRLHSQLDHGATSAESKIHGREPLRMHPTDAAYRALSAGDVVRVVSATGSALAAVVISDSVRPGVVQLATGAWFDPSAPDVATCIHGNPNAVTRDIGTSRLAQGCTGQLTRVEVQGFAAAPPPLRIYDPPVAQEN